MVTPYPITRNEFHHLEPVDSTCLFTSLRTPRRFRLAGRSNSLTILVQREHRRFDYPYSILVIQERLQPDCLVKHGMML